VKKLLILLLPLLAGLDARSQFSAYDPFDDNANEWIVFNNDTGSAAVAYGKLDVSIKADTDFIDAKGARIDPAKPFRAEIRTGFSSGSENAPYGLCWGAMDDRNYYVFYITAAGNYGFRSMQHGKWIDILPATTSAAVNVKGSNWLRVNSLSNADGSKKLALCINEEVVKTIDYVAPMGTYYGIYSHGVQHILFDDFIVYQRGDVQEEFEPADLALSLACKASQLHYTHALYNWSCCVEKGCRVDVDSMITRFWYTDMRAGDYSVLVAPFEATGNGDFFYAAERDFVEYMHDTTEPVKPLQEDKAMKVSIGNEAMVVQLGQSYSAAELQGNMYIRRYYVNHPYHGESGLMFQFIVPENSTYIPVLDQLVQQVVSTLEFR